MISYADVVTMLLPVFIVLFVSSRDDANPARVERPTLEQGEPAARVSDIPKASVLSPPPTMISSAAPPARAPSRPTAPLQTAEAVLESEIEALVASLDLSQRVQTRRERRGLVVSLIEAGFFETGSATPRADALPMIDSLGGLIAKSLLHLRIEGHTDDTPIRTARFPSNWELSTARATWLVAYLSDRFELAPERLSAAGYGQFRPVASNDTAAGRAKNRRIDIVVLTPDEARNEPVATDGVSSP